MTTCYSPFESGTIGWARDWRKGDSVEEALEYLGQTAEGVPTTRATLRIARQLGVEMPITETAHKVMFEGVPPTEAMGDLMRRELQRE